MEEYWKLRAHCGSSGPFPSLQMLLLTCVASQPSRELHDGDEGQARARLRVGLWRGWFSRTCCVCTETTIFFSLLSVFFRLSLSPLLDLTTSLSLVSTLSNESKRPCFQGGEQSQTRPSAATRNRISQASGPLGFPRGGLKVFSRVNLASLTDSPNLLERGQSSPVYYLGSQRT